MISLRSSIPYISASLIFFLVSCASKESPNNNSAPAENESPSSSAYPTILQNALEAHGGLDRWDSFERLEYDLYRGEDMVDHQLIALKTRKVLLSNEQYTIGFDGQEVWVSPDTSAYAGRSARFYHNLQFYFFALPFVLADPGIQYEELEPREFQGKTYDVLRITYQPEVGDAADDEYIAYFNQETHQLHLLLYTVTYFSQTPSDRYTARVYEAWQSVNGLKVPLRAVAYRWADGSLGDQRSVTEYRNVTLDEIPPDQSMFLMPNEASIADR
ncbi:MAG: DUF6503 family protein [Cyclobacteriaceae bacterium]